MNIKGKTRLDYGCDYENLDLINITVIRRKNIL